MKIPFKQCVFLLSILATSLAGCSKPFEAATPKGFIDLGDHYDETAHEYRAATADGVVISIRAFKNDPKADMPLAVRALENRVRVAQGYALISKREVSARDGSTGTLLEFGHDEATGTDLYDVALFINDDHVFLVEAGGKKELVEKARPSVDWAIKNFLPK